MRQTKYPAGWDEERGRRVLEHYETQSEEEAVAEDEAGDEGTTHTAMEVPVDLVPAVRELSASVRRGALRGEAREASREKRGPGPPARSRESGLPSLECWCMVSVWRD